MGIFKVLWKWLVRLYRWASEVYNAWGLAALLGLAPAGAMGWAASQLSWFWAALGWFGIGAVVLVVWMLTSIALAEYQRYAYHRERRTAMAAAPSDHGTESGAVYEPAPQVLIDFALDHVYPTYEALKAIQRALVARECPNSIMQGFANMGVEHDYEISTFRKGIEGISRFGMSPPEPVTKDEMIFYVHALETGYKAVTAQTLRLAIGAGAINLKGHPDFSGMYEKWVRMHNAMIAAYEPIKRDRAMGELFRPARNSRWGSPLAEVEISPLEIIFDANNPSRKFWSLEQASDGEGKPTPLSYWEYRALIQNNSKKTVRNVRVTVQAEGQMPTLPELSHFIVNKQPTIDLNPGDAHLAVIRRFTHPLKQAGTVLGPGAYGPVRMIVSADDVAAISKMFQVDMDKTPPLFEMPRVL